MSASLKNTKRLKVAIVGFAVLTVVSTVSALVLSDPALLRSLLNLLPAFAAVSILAVAFTLSILKRGRRALVEEGGSLDRESLRVNASTGLKMRGAVDSGGWTYGTGRDDFERRL